MRARDESVRDGARGGVAAYVMADEVVEGSRCEEIVGHSVSSTKGVRIDRVCGGCHVQIDHASRPTAAVRAYVHVSTEHKCTLVIILCSLHAKYSVILVCGSKQRCNGAAAAPETWSQVHCETQLMRFLS